jgi:hypothetical protein
MAAAALDLADVLGGLLRAEQADVFTYLASEADPYLGADSLALRPLLPAMTRTARRREGELAALVDDLGGILRPVGVAAEVQYLAYLSAQYLLPRLIESRRRGIDRYARTIEALADAPPDIVSLLRSHLAEMREELAQLEAAVPPVTGPSLEASGPE